MPMGLTNAQAIFMRMMNNLFKDMLDQGVVIFFGDMLIYSTMSEGDFKLLEKVLACPTKVRIFLQTEKVQLLTMDHHLPRI